MAKRGPRVRYNPEIHPVIIENLAKKGFIDEKIAKTLGISVRQFHRWKKNHPEIRHPIQRGKAKIDEEVEEALLKRALGYPYNEEREEREGGVITKTILIKKQMAGEVSAQRFWLMNRKPAEWRERSQVELPQLNRALSLLEAEFNRARRRRIKTVKRLKP